MSGASRAGSAIAEAVDQIRLVDTHEHIGMVIRGDDLDPAREWSRRAEPVAERTWVEHGPADVLQDLLGRSYVHSDLIVAGATPDAVERAGSGTGGLAERFDAIRGAWAAVRHTGFGEAVATHAAEIYGLEELTPAGLEEAQPRLEELRRPGAMVRLLREGAGIDHVQIDDVLCECVGDPTAPDFFLHDISCLPFCSGYVDPELLLEVTGVEVRNTDDLREAMASIFRRFGACAIAVKSQHAYYRTLRWEERSDEEAQRVLTAIQSSEHLGASDRLVLGDWCLARAVELAAEHDLPFKLHTGYYSGTGGMPVDRIRSGNLCALLERYPDSRFVLMHIAYPYSDELVALAKHYPNVWVDMCWAWSIDPYSSADFLRRFLHAVPANKLFAFGGDTAFPTQAFAYARQARLWLTKMLESEVAEANISQSAAISLAERWLGANQRECFDIEGTRAACRAQLESVVG